MSFLHRLDPILIFLTTCAVQWTSWSCNCLRRFRCLSQILFLLSCSFSQSFFRCMILLLTKTSSFYVCWQNNSTKRSSFHPFSTNYEYSLIPMVLRCTIPWIHFSRVQDCSYLFTVWYSFEISITIDDLRQLSMRSHQWNIFPSHIIDRLKRAARVNIRQL